MSEEKPVVGIFTMPQEFACGKDSTCCGPIGQSEEVVAALRASIEELGVAVEVHNVKRLEVQKNHPNVAKLLRTFGMGVVPILAVGDDVVGMRFETVEQVVDAVRQKLPEPSPVV